MHFHIHANFWPGYNDNCRCRFEFCSLCCRKIHFALSCDELPNTEMVNLTMRTQLYRTVVFTANVNPVQWYSAADSGIVFAIPLSGKFLRIWSVVDLCRRTKYLKYLENFINLFICVLLPVFVFGACSCPPILSSFLPTLLARFYALFCTDDGCKLEKHSLWWKFYTRYN